MVNLRKIAGLVLVAPGLLACAPEFSERSSDVITPRVLGIRSTPAEALPGTNVSYQLLVGGVDGTVASPRAQWSYCTQPKATNELNDVAPACFGEGDFRRAVRHRRGADRQVAGQCLRPVRSRRSATFVRLGH